VLTRPSRTWGLQGRDADNRQQGRHGRRVWSRLKSRAACTGAARPGNGIPRARAYFGRGRTGLSENQKNREVQITSRIFVSMSTAPQARAVRGSTPPTPRCESRICPPGLSSPARTNARSYEQTRALQVLALGLQALAEEQAQATRRGSAVRSRTVTAANASALQLPGETGSPTPDQFQGPQSRSGLDGDLDALFDALSAADKQSRLQQA